MHFTPSPITMLTADGTVSLNLLNVATLPVQSLSSLVYVGMWALSTISFASILILNISTVILYIQTAIYQCKDISIQNNPFETGEI